MWSILEFFICFKLGFFDVDFEMGDAINGYCREKRIVRSCYQLVWLFQGNSSVSLQGRFGGFLEYFLRYFIIFYLGIFQMIINNVISLKLKLKDSEVVQFREKNFFEEGGGFGQRFFFY